MPGFKLCVQPKHIMATTHYLSVITNNCVKQPRNPSTGLSTSLNERVGANEGISQISVNANGDYDQSYVNINDDSTNHQRVFNQTDSYVGNITADLAGLDDNEFYKRLIDLKEEHKKTLELCEQLYQNKVGASYSTKTNPKCGDAIIDCDKTDPKIKQDFKPIFGKTETFQNFENNNSSDDKDFHRESNLSHEDLNLSFRKPPVPPPSTARLSSSKAPVVCNSIEDERADAPRSQSEQKFWRSLSASSSETNLNVSDVANNTVSRSFSHHHTNLNVSARSSALSLIEDMWDTFSINDYAPRNSKIRPRSNSLSRLSQTSSGKRFQDRPTSATDWKHRITIPKPFNLTKSENKEVTKSKALQEYELQQLTYAREEEEECQKQFKATPVPAHIYIPLFDEIMQQKESKKQERLKKSIELSQSMEKPFAFMKRENERKNSPSLSASTKFGKKLDQGKKKSFKAKPYPAHLFHGSTEDKLLEEEEYRKIRMQIRAEEMMRKSKLPPNMSARGEDYTNAKDRQKKLATKLNKAGFEDDYTFTPKVNSEVPDFDKMHRELHKTMANKKFIKEATVCKPFNLRSSKTSNAQQMVFDDIDRDESTLKENRWPFTNSRQKVYSSSLTSESYIFLIRRIPLN